MVSLRFFIKPSPTNKVSGRVADRNVVFGGCRSTGTVRFNHGFLLDPSQRGFFLAGKLAAIAFEERARFDGQSFLDDIGYDLGRLGKGYVPRLDLAGDSAGDQDILSVDGSTNHRRGTNRQLFASDVTLDRTIDLNVAVTFEVPVNNQVGAKQSGCLVLQQAGVRTRNFFFIFEHFLSPLGTSWG